MTATSKTEVFKIQRSACGRFVLLYNEDDTTLKQVPWKEVRNFLGIHGMRPMTKRYVYAEVSDTAIHITGPAPAQEW